MWKKLTALLCLTILLSSCSGSIRIEIGGPPLEGQVHLGPFGTSDNYFPVIEGSVEAMNYATYRTYGAFSGWRNGEYWYRFARLPAGDYRIRGYTLLGYADRYVTYPRETTWPPILIELPWYFDNAMFVQLGGMQYPIGRDSRGYIIYSDPEPLTRWANGTVYYYFDGLSSTARSRIRSILNQWQNEILSNANVAPVVIFRETYSYAAADLVFREEPYQSQAVSVARNWNSSGYLTRVTVRFNAWTPDKAICNYGIALAMGMGNSPDAYSVLHWEYRAGQAQELSDREKGYARIMYSIRPGLTAYVSGGYSLFADGFSLFSTGVDFEMEQNVEPGSVVVGK